MTRIFLGVLTASLLMIQSVKGESRVMSFHLESIAALQAQLFQAAQIFDAPELGSAPMMFNMMVPGYAQLDRDASLAVHIYSGDAGQFGMVIDLQTLGAPETFLGSIFASQGLPLPDPIDGRYVSEQGVAQIHQNRVIMGQDGDALDMAFRVGIPEDLPDDIPGLLRIDMEPAQLMSLLDHFQSMTEDVMPDDHEHAEMFEEVLGLYRAVFGQISSYKFGIRVQEHGLEFSSRVQPKENRALATIIDSLQGVHTGWIPRLEQEQVFGVVTGGYDVPEELMHRLLDMYIGWMQNMSHDMAMDADVMRASMQPTIKTIGSPSFVFADVTDTGALDIVSGITLDHADKVLAQMIELTQSEAYQTSMAQSGMKMSEPQQREIEGVDVYRWSIELDEELFLQQMEEAGGAEVDLEHWKVMQSMMEKFFSGYDYAATADGLIFSMSDEAGLIRAMALLREAQDADGKVSSVLLERIGAPVMPYAIGRLDLLALLRSIRSLGVTQIPLISAEGEGVVFAGWREDDGVAQTILIPASDIRAIRHAISAMIH